jgi:hypothetical protein
MGDLGRKRAFGFWSPGLQRETSRVLLLGFMLTNLNSSCVGYSVYFSFVFVHMHKYIKLSKVKLDEVEAYKNTYKALLVLIGPLVRMVPRLGSLMSVAQRSAKVVSSQLHPLTAVSVESKPLSCYRMTSVHAMPGWRDDSHSFQGTT